MAPSCDPKDDNFCIYNIPVFGGFCAPTKNPDTSCYRHVSNEYTVPGSGPYMKLAPIIEFSPPCIACGKLGIAFGDRNRKILMTVAIVLNLVALILTIIAAVGGLSTSPDALIVLGFVHGEGFINVGQTSIKVNICFGAKMWINRIDCRGDDSCAQFLTNNNLWTSVGDNIFERGALWEDATPCSGPDDLIPDAPCQECRESLLTESSLIISIITQIPTLTTDCQRSTRFGDVNCQATVGALTGTLGLVSGLASALAFRSACFSDLRNSYEDLTVDWRLGPGFRCLIGALIIKLIDVVIHLIVPTPCERWKKVQSGVALRDYMLLAPPTPEVMLKSEDQNEKE